VLMRINEPQSNHNGGMLSFGPDKYLYIALGDGGGSNDNSGGVNSTADGHTNQNNPDGTGGVGFLGHGNGQDRRNVYGKILRIKPTTESDPVGAPSTTLSGQYRIPDDNPFTAASNPVGGQQIPGWQASWVDEVYAFGLRNPFRITFDSETGKLYAGDVGQGTREEVDNIVKGGNYGWVAREGLIQNPSYPLATNPTYVPAAGTSFTDPIASYVNGSSGSGGTAVIGGYVYRGDHNPALEGKYVFGDLSRQSSGAAAGGRFMYMDINEPGPNQIFDMTITGALAKPTARLDGIAEDANGELYYLFETGQVIKLLPKLIPGDYNLDGRVNETDYALWRSAVGTSGANLAADGNGNGVVDAADYVIWRKYNGTSVGSGAGDFAAIPEAKSAVIFGQASFVFVCSAFRWRRCRCA
jgi:glucose/arabinose dehydrogenase